MESLENVIILLFALILLGHIHLDACFSSVHHEELKDTLKLFELTMGVKGLQLLYLNCRRDLCFTTMVKFQNKTNICHQLAPNSCRNSSLCPLKPNDILLKISWYVRVTNYLHGQKSCISHFISRKKAVYSRETCFVLIWQRERGMSFSKRSSLLCTVL